MLYSKYRIIYRNEQRRVKESLFTDWDETALYVKQLDERGLEYDLYEKQGNFWIPICNQEGS